MKQQNSEKAPKNHAPKKKAEPIIKYDINIPEDRDPQPKDYDEIEY